MSAPRGWPKVVPLLGQVSGYSKHALRGDAVASASVAATLIPQGLAYGAVAGLAPVSGLYTAIAGGLVFALLTSSRFVAVGPSSAAAVITFAAVQGPAGGDPARAVVLATWLAVLAGGLYLLAALFRVKAVADLLSAPVLLGYLAGSAVVIFAGQIGVLIGVPAKGDGPLPKIWSVLAQLDQAHAATATVGLGGVALLVLLKRYPRRLPALLVMMAAAITASATLGLADRGVAVVGAFAGGLPTPVTQPITLDEFWSLLGPAAAIALIGTVEGVAALRATVNPLEQRGSLRRETAALGAASIGSGLIGGFATSPSRSRSVSARAAGAHSQLFQVGSALIVFVVVLTGGPLFAQLPLAALAAAVIVGTVPRMIDVPGFLQLWRHWRTESIIALAAAVGVASLGVLKGMVIAVTLAVAQLVLRAARPHDVVLAISNPGEPAYKVDERDLAEADVLIYRMDAPLFFANIGRVQSRILALLAASHGKLRYLILDAESVFYIDATAAQALADLTANFQERGCRLLLARVHPPVLAALRTNPYRDGVTRTLPVFPSIQEAHAAAKEGTA